MVNQCGYYITEHITISFKLWKKSKSTDNDADIVRDIEKEMLWVDVKRHFSFSEDREELFKDWVIKMMAFAFQAQEKLEQRLYKKGLTPDVEKDFKNQVDYLVRLHKSGIFVIKLII